MTMSDRIATTPFGGGPFTAALFRAQEKLAADRDALKSSSNRTGKVDKWQFLRALTEARAVYALSDRTIAVLEALMSFYPEKELDGARDMIVFPSNAELSLRSRGMAPATLRRHIATLIKTGLLLRKDSPNGKRFARKGPGGELTDQFGFNLAPSAMMAPEVFQHAEAVRAEAAAIRKVRGEITLHLRDISKMIEAAYEDGQGTRQPALWAGFTEALRALSGKVARNGTLNDHGARCDALVRLRADVERAFLAGMDEADLQERDVQEAAEETVRFSDKTQKMSGNDVQSERHIQNSNKKDSFEYCSDNNEAERAGDFDTSPGRHGAGEAENIAEAANVEALTAGNRGEANLSKRATEPAHGRNGLEKVSIAELKQACPAFTDYALDGLDDWRAARDAAELARPMLGISKDAWLRALTAMGPAGAVVTVAYLIERATEIKSAGGYLRALTEKAETGKLRLRPMIDSLLNR